MPKVFPGWRMVAVALLANAVSSATIYTAYSIIAAPLSEAFEPSRMVLMFGIMAVSLVSGCLSPALGVALDRYSVRKLMAGGAMCLVVGFFLLSLAQDMTQVILVYAIFMPVAAVLVGPLATSTLLARWFSRRRGLAMGIAASGSAVGGLLFPPFIQFLIDSYEWRAALKIVSVLSFVLTVPMFLGLIIDRPADRNLFPDGDNEAAAVSVMRQRPAPVTSTRAVLRDVNFWLIAMVIGIGFAGPMGLVSNLVPFVMGLGIEASKGAVLLSIFSAAGFAGKLLCAAIADRVNYRLALAAILTALGLGMFGYLQSAGFMMLLLSSILIGTVSGAISPLWSVILAHVYGPESMGRVMGLMTFIFLPFTMLSPPIFGWVYDMTGSYDNAFIGYVALLGIGLLLLSLLQAGKTGTPAQLATS